MIKSIWKRMNCAHRTGSVVAIGYGGETTIQCSECGKLFEMPLNGGKKIKPGIIFRAKRCLAFGWTY